MTDREDLVLKDGSQSSVNNGFSVLLKKKNYP